MNSANIIITKSCAKYDKKLHSVIYIINIYYLNICLFSGIKWK